MMRVEGVFEIIESLSPMVGSELVPLEQALGRISAHEVLARMSLPLFDHSAMDGYAVRIEDAGDSIRISHTILAGDVEEVQLVESQCMRIMTGAKIPRGCEAIVPFEEAQREGDRVRLSASIRAGAHIRLKGEEIQANDQLIPPHHRLGAYDIALLASQGITHIEVHRRLRVAILATGNEIKMPYETLAPHQLYNANSYFLHARVQEMGCDVQMGSIVLDDLEALVASLQRYHDADVILTSGGVSVGDADHLHEAIRALGGEILVDAIAIKPGKPTTLGRIGPQIILALAGNPSAAALCFELFAPVLIAQLSHDRARYHLPIEAVLGSDVLLKRPQATLILGQWDGISFTPDAQSAPGRITPLARNNAILYTQTSLLARTPIRVLVRTHMSTKPYPILSGE